MSKPYTADDFSAQTTQNLTWRLREISDLKIAIRVADDSLKRVLLRSIVTICYAHWEGYVRFSAKKYMEHVALRKHSYAELAPQFIHNYFLPRLAALSTSKSSVSERCDLICEILDSQDSRFSRVNDDLINTRANLNSEVLADICLVCDVGRELMEDKSTFIDTILLKRRNAIAHGEDTFIHEIDLNELVDETISLMRTFGNALENSVQLRAYRV